MMFQKSYWINVTAEIDVLPIIHDVRLAVRESQVTEGMLILYLPDTRGAIIVAPEGFEKDQEFRSWVKLWTEARTDAPKMKYFSYLLGVQVTLPLQKDKIGLDPWHAPYLIDLGAEAGRREFCVSIFSESPKVEGKAEGQRRAR